MHPRWLELARRFQALAQSGLAYCTDPYDRERYEESRRLAAQMKTWGAGLSNIVAIENLFQKRSWLRDSESRRSGRVF